MEIATPYTGGSVLWSAMRKAMHDPLEPLRVLARNLKAVMERKEESARKVALQVGMSNKTISTMANGTGNPQIQKLLAVAEKIGVPLWQLLCPALPAERIGEKELHELIENYAAADPKDRGNIARMADLAAQANKSRQAA